MRIISSVNLVFSLQQCRFNINIPCFSIGIPVLSLCCEYVYPQIRSLYWSGPQRRLHKKEITKPLHCTVDFHHRGTVVRNTHVWSYAWWRHQMEIFSTLLAIWAGNSPVTGEFPAQRPVRSFDVSFDFRLNKRLSKQSWVWWFDTPPRSLWRHRNVLWISPSSDTSHEMWTWFCFASLCCGYAL